MHSMSRCLRLHRQQAWYAGNSLSAQSLCRDRLLYKAWVRMSEYVSYGPLVTENQFPTQDTKHTTHDTPPARRLLYCILVFVVLLCVGLLASVAIWRGTWACPEPEVRRRRPPRILAPKALECPCDLNYPIFLGIMAVSLISVTISITACSFFLRKSWPTSTDKKTLPLIVFMYVLFAVFSIFLVLTIASWARSDSSCGPELYNTGFLVLLIAFPILMALCWLQ